MSLSTRVLVALGAGIAAGIALSLVDAGVSRAIVAVVEPFGTLFVNAIRMTVLPLVVSSLIVGVASTEDRAMLARVGGRGILVFVLLLTVSGGLAALVTPPLMANLQLDPAAVAQVRAASPSASSIAAGAASIQGPAAWLVSLVPSNAIAAAADGAMLPLIIFALALGLALGAVEANARNEVVLFFRAITESMLTLVRWLLVVAPLGVFALALPLVARLGLARRRRAGRIRDPRVGGGGRTDRLRADTGGHTGRRRVPRESSSAPRCPRRRSRSRRGRRSPRSPR